MGLRWQFLGFVLFGGAHQALPVVLFLRRRRLGPMVREGNFLQSSDLQVCPFFKETFQHW